MQQGKLESSPQADLYQGLKSPNFQVRHGGAAAGENIPYSYSHLFAYNIGLPAATRTVKLPNNPNIRILAISVAEENPELKPAQPLYDVLPRVAAESH